MAEATPTDGGTPPEGAPAEGQEPAAEHGETPPPEGEERQYSAAYVKQLRRESAGFRERLAALEAEKQEREDADKTEVQRAQERADAAEQRAAEAELRALRRDIADEHELPAHAVQFLTGTTREEIELRATELAELLKDKAKPTAGGFDGGARTPPPPQRDTPEREHNDFLLRAMGRAPREGRAT